MINYDFFLFFAACSYEVSQLIIVLISLCKNWQHWRADAVGWLHCMIPWFCFEQSLRFSLFQGCGVLFVYQIQKLLKISTRLSKGQVSFWNTWRHDDRCYETTSKKRFLATLPVGTDKLECMHEVRRHVVWRWPHLLKVSDCWLCISFFAGLFT